MVIPATSRCLQHPFYIDDVAAVREKLARAERDGTLMGQVWSSVRRRAQAAPQAFPWFTPFVALVTGEERDLEAARQSIRNYVNTFEWQPFQMGLQFHFWCFAFPHARWSLYFQWLHSIGAWDEEEGQRLMEALTSFQFENFFYGMRTKPEPECVDNQTMSLCYSNALVGYLFSQAPWGSVTARRLYEEGARRLPSMLGGMPESGYSGEGSTYMDHVVGPCVPLLVEFLERTHGGEWFTPRLAPHNGSAESIVRMIAREWTPSGLLLPWDHYGYSLPTRSCIAYGAYRLREPLYFALLEQHADWTHDISIGWGYDDLIWSLVWWPDVRPAATSRVFPSWAAPEVGGALVSEQADLYLMQMWDETTPVTPGRAHVNPNALALCAYGSPLTMDGVPAKSCTAFNFDDTWIEVKNQDFTPVRSNYGVGCAGAHGVLLVDQWEGMRAYTAYTPQATLADFDADAATITGDVTPLYREHWADAITVRRRSRLCENRFWLIEDLAAFAQEHQVTARWFLRPGQRAAERGVMIETAEGVRLHLLPLLGPDGPTTREVAGFPERLDGASLQVDFTQRGQECRWLWLAWPMTTRSVQAEIAEDWQVVADPECSFDFAVGSAAVRESSLRLPFTRPAFMLADLPIARRWWYRKCLTAPDGPWWLRLPRQSQQARLWVNGAEVDMTPYRPRIELLAPQVAMTASGEVEIIVCYDCGISQYGKEDKGGSAFSGVPAVLTPCDPATITSAGYADGRVTITAGGRTWQVAHELLTVEA